LTAVNSVATVTLPVLAGTAGIVLEGGTEVWSGQQYIPGVPGITGAAGSNSSVVLSVGSGSYAFVVV
jgi:hypothetical protein